MSEKLQLIVGLGNPGQQYAATRHNVGVWCIQAICEQARVELKLESKFKALVGKINIDNQTIIIAIPTTYMNESGQPLRALAQFYKIKPEETLIIHDELDLPPGAARYKFDGGHGGHNGLRDIIQTLGSARFARLRIGIGRPTHKDQVTQFVLHPPSKHEEQLIDTSIERALIELSLVVTGQLEKAMLNLHTEEK
jgi:peptidyl-tRNA hydrolase, PTH1 family